jgi:hypothetical protein
MNRVSLKSTGWSTSTSLYIDQHIRWKYFAELVTSSSTSNWGAALRPPDGVPWNLEPLDLFLQNER